jgi:hypothetical protein
MTRRRKCCTNLTNSTSSIATSSSDNSTITSSTNTTSSASNYTDTGSGDASTDTRSTDTFSNEHSTSDGSARSSTAPPSGSSSGRDGTSSGISDPVVDDFTEEALSAQSRVAFNSAPCLPTLSISPPLSHNKTRIDQPSRCRAELAGSLCAYQSHPHPFTRLFVF